MMLVNTKLNWQIGLETRNAQQLLLYIVSCIVLVATIVMIHTINVLINYQIYSKNLIIFLF